MSSTECFSLTLILVSSMTLAGAIYIGNHRHIEYQSKQGFCERTMTGSTHIGWYPCVIPDRQGQLFPRR